MSLNNCLVICSSGAEATSTTMVMRDSASSSVGATARLKMLKPRRANSEATLARTPGRFCTSTDKMWCDGLLKEGGVMAVIAVRPSAEPARREG